MGIRSICLTRVFILLLALLLALPISLLLGCAGKAQTVNNFVFAMTGFPLVAYPGESFTPSPQFTAYNLSPTLTVDTALSDTVALSAYSDSNCTQSAKGTLTAQNLDISFTNGVANFSDVKFSWTNLLEGTIYLRGGLQTNSTVHYCSIGIPVIQHFNKNTGFIVSGSTGAAGATAAAELDIGAVVQIDSSGKYVVAGNSKNTSGGKEAAISRYLQNGNLDTSFGTNGIVHFGSAGAAGATGANELDTVNALKIDSNGNYVLAGSSRNASNGIEVTLWRYKSDGTLDSSFGSGGVVHAGSPGAAGGTTASTVNDNIYSLQIDSNNNLIVTGVSFNGTNGSGYELFVERYTSAGVLDTTFGTNGIYHFGTTGAAGATGSHEFDAGASLQIDSNDNTYVIAGWSANSSNKSEMVIWKVSTSGTLVTSWGSSGVLLSGTIGMEGNSLSSTDNQGLSLLIDSKGDYVIAGNSITSAGGVELALWRYLTSAGGALDSSFGSNGVVLSGTTGAAGATGASELDWPTSLAEDSLGNYIVAGSSANSTGGTQFTLWRYKSSGNLDTEFSITTKSGIVTLSTPGAAGATGSSMNDLPLSLVLDQFGTYIISGYSQNTSSGIELAIWRFLPTGTLDL